MDEKTPLPSPTDEKKPSVADKAEERRHRDKLGHLQGVKGEKVRAQISAADRLSELIEEAAERQSGAKSKVKQGGQKAVRATGDVFSLIKRNKKWFALSGLALALVALIIVIAPFIPLQIQRSSGFAAFQDKNYDEAMRELQSYLLQRPADSSAAYTAARAALFTGEVEYAQRIIDDLYSAGKLPETAIGFYYALLHADQHETALSALNRALTNVPAHPGALLLRGVLLGQQDNSARMARDDFLQVNAITRASGDFDDLNLLHRVFQQKNYLVPPLLVQHGGEVRCELTRYLGFNPTWDGFIPQLRYSSAQPLLDEELSASSVVDYYFADMLLRQDELQEASSALTSLARSAPNSLAAIQAQAVLDIYSGNYAGAKQQLEKMLEQLPEDATTINNLATIELIAVAEDEAVNILRMGDLYRTLLTVPETDAIALGNGAYVALLNDDYETAQALLDKINTDNPEDSLAQVRLSRALLALVNGDEAAAESGFGSIASDEIPRINRYLLAIYEKSGKTEIAIGLLRQGENNESLENQEIFIEYVRLLWKRGEWRLALVELQDFLQRNSTHHEARYLLGQLALILGEEEVLAEQRQVLAGLSARGDIEQHYSYALEGAFSYQRGEVDIAAADYLQAIQLAPTLQHRYEYVEAWAQIYADINPEEVALILYGYLQEYESAELKSLLAYVLADTYEREATKYAEEAARFNRSYIVNLYAGAALAKVGIYAEALPLLEAANDFRPGQIKVLKVLQQVYAGMGDSEREQNVVRITDYLNALGRGEGPATQASYKIYLPSDDKTLMQAVSAAVSDTSGYSDALEAYATALAKTGQSPSERAGILYSQATFEAYNKAYRKAAELLEEALALGLSEPQEQINTMLFYAEVLSLLDRHQQAADMLEQIMNIDGEQLLYRRLHAEAVREAGQPQTAVELLMGLIADYPVNAESYYALAKSYIALAELESAIAVLKKLLLVAPNHAPAYTLLAEVYQTQEDKEKAVRYSRVYSSIESTT